MDTSSFLLCGWSSCSLVFFVESILPRYEVVTLRESLLR